MVLLEISIGIAGISFVMLVVVHSAYSDKINELKKKNVEKLDSNALELRKELGEQWTPDSRKKLSELLKKYAEADQPKEWLQQAIYLFLYSALAAALGVLCDLATIVPNSGVSAFGLLEGPFAFFAVIFLIWAAYHTFQVIKFLSNPEDPELPSLPMIVLVGLIQFSDIVWLYIYFPFLPSTQYISLKIFIGTLIVSVVMGFILILRWEADISLAEKIIEIGSFGSPYVVLAIVIILSTLHIPLF